MSQYGPDFWSNWEELRKNCNLVGRACCKIRYPNAESAFSGNCRSHGQIKPTLLSLTVLLGKFDRLFVEFPVAANGLFVAKPHALEEEKWKVVNATFRFIF